MQRVLVTGATGFIGKHTLPLLSNGFEVHAVSSKPINSDNNNYIWHQADLLETRRFRARYFKFLCRPKGQTNTTWIVDSPRGNG